MICGKITSKQMVACYFCKTGHVATAPLEHRRTVNSEWNTAICLPNVFGVIRKTNKRRRIIVHHVNASSHTSAQISTLLKGHTPYTPDLTTNDFSLFPHIKKKCVANDFRHQKRLLECSKTLFWRCLNRSGKTTTNDVKLYYGNARFNLATSEIC